MIGYIWNANWFTSAIISFFAWINAGIYGLVSIVCSLISNISNTTFNDSLLGNFQTRIYIVLAIYMLFKLAFSLLSSIVNPEQLLDKEKGMQKIIPRTIVALIMLIMFPTIFDYAMKWQNDIVEFIPRIIIGRKVTLDEEGIGGEGARIAATALSAFITPNEDCKDFSEEDIASVDSYIDTSSFGNVVDATIQRCDATKSEFKYEFSGLVSLIVGIILIFILATYCIDIGIRVLKLGILKILSPIPIISYIDPKSQKSGAFGNWLKECVSTYVELFIKMGILHFTLFILGNLSDSSTSLFKYPENATISRPFIMLVLIISSFFFMGKAAQFICNILGIKYDKGSGGVLGKALGIAGGALLGAGVGAAGALIAGGSGMHGVAKAALEGIGNGAGGKPLTSFNKGRDIAAQIKTGDPNAKYKNWLTRAGDSINKRRAESLGFTETPYDENGAPIYDENGKQILGTVDKAKGAMYDAKNEMNNAAAMRDRYNSGNLTEADKKLMNKLRNSEGYEGKDDGQILDKYYNSAVSNAGKAEKYYNDAKQYATILGIKTGKTVGEQFKEEGFTPDKYKAVRLEPSQNIHHPGGISQPNNTLPPYNTETKSGILLNPSPEMEKKIMDDARKNGQIK